MSPRNADLACILRAAADPDRPDSEALTLARIRAAGMTPNHDAVTDWIAATADLRRLTDDPTLARTLVPGIARSAAVDAVQVARMVLEQRCDDAVAVIARRPVVAA